MDKELEEEIKRLKADGWTEVIDGDNLTWPPEQESVLVTWYNSFKPTMCRRIGNYVMIHPYDGMRHLPMDQVLAWKKLRDGNGKSH